MTFSAQFEVTEVGDGKAVAKASTQPGTTDRQEYGTLTQNTERVTRMELRLEFEDGVNPSMQVGDELSVHGHFNA
jgi:hypothetical protein